MKRDQLKELGLSEEQIKSVMDINGEDINRTKATNTETAKENETTLYVVFNFNDTKVKLIYLKMTTFYQYLNLDNNKIVTIKGKRFYRIGKDKYVKVANVKKD